MDTIKGMIELIYREKDYILANECGDLTLRWHSNGVDIITPHRDKLSYPQESSCVKSLNKV